MSVKVMAQVWEKSAHRGTNLLVLLALADWANEDGLSIYPSVPTLARKARVSERAVQYALRQLEQSGEITTDVKGHRNENGNSTNDYQINLSRLGGAKSAPGWCSPLHQGGAAHCTEVVKLAAPNPSVSTNEPPHTAQQNSHVPIRDQENPEKAEPSNTNRPVPSSKEPRILAYFREFGIKPTETQVFEIMDRVGKDKLDAWKKALHDFHVNEPERNWTRVGWICDRFVKACQSKPQQATYQAGATSRTRNAAGRRPQVEDYTPAQRAEAERKAVDQLDVMRQTRLARVQAMTPAEREKERARLEKRVIEARQHAAANPKDAGTCEERIHKYQAEMGELQAVAVMHG